MGEENEIRVGLVKDHQVKPVIDFIATSYWANYFQDPSADMIDSFVIDLRQLPDNLGFNAEGKGLMLTGTWQSLSSTLDWKWLILKPNSDEVLQEKPAGLKYH